VTFGEGQPHMRLPLVVCGLFRLGLTLKKTRLHRYRLARLLNEPIAAV
jgi:hypothetical protein